MPNAYRDRHQLSSTHGQDAAALSEYLAGKRVVLVGPAASLLGRGLGDEIDSYDVVVRLNLASPVPAGRRADVGSRTDVLYHVLYSANHLKQLGRQHTAEEVAAWQTDGVRFLVTRHELHNERVRRIRPLLGDLPLLLIPERFKAQVAHHAQSNPNTGTLAIAHLLAHPVASLHVAGFDFYESGYYEGYGGFTAAEGARAAGGLGYAAWAQVGSTREVHRQDGQKRYLAELYAQDARLNFDDVAAAALKLAERPPTITALVPMKGQSERVPGKNVRPLCGKPLLYWTLSALHEASRVASVVVDTDSEEIAALVRQHHPQTRVLMRPDHLRDGATVTGNMLIEWELSQVAGDHFGQFHVTSPLLTPETIDRAVEAYFAGLDEHDSLMTVTEHHMWLFRGDGTPVNSDTRKLVRSQDLAPLFEDNNAAHLFSRSSFGRTGSRIGERPQMFRMSKLEAIDIDYEEDFVIAEAVMRAVHA